MSLRPSLSYASMSTGGLGTNTRDVYVLQDEDDAFAAYNVGDEDDLSIVDPACGCCCKSISQSPDGEKKKLVTLVNILTLLSAILFCMVASATVYSTHLAAHLLELCKDLKIAFICIPIFCGLLWILGIVLLVRSFKFRQYQHRRMLAKGALIKERDELSSAPAPHSPCTCRKVSRVLFNFTFWTFFIILNAIILVVFSALLYFYAHSLPLQSGTMSMNRGTLNYPAGISRTKHGVLHIQSVDPNSAANYDYDLFFAQGMAHAQARMWQMEFQRAVVTGRLSERVGQNENALKIDKLARTLHFQKHAETAFTSLTIKSRGIITAYCDGVNAWIHNKKFTLPIEFTLLGLGKPDDWLPADVLGWTKMVSFMLSGNMDNELLRWDLSQLLNITTDRIEELLPPYDATLFPIILEGEIDEADMTGYNHELNPKVEPIVEWMASADGQAFRAKLAAATAGESGSEKAGRMFTKASTPFSAFRSMFGPSTASNNWVLSSNRTTNGAPLMCNDPHLQLMAPSIWILNHLESPSFKAVGASFVGTPGVILGHNDYISWSVTNVGADVQDLFIMNGNYTHYTRNGVTTTYVHREEVIKVKHHKDVVITVRESFYGPVISDLGTSFQDWLTVDQALSLQWTSLDASDTTFDAFLGINSATNWTEFQTALESYIAPSQNMLYADRMGNIGYQTTGRIPLRPNNNTGKYPVPGNGTNDWVRMVDFSEMPRCYNPKKGYFATANNAVVPVGYKTYVTGDWDAGSDGYRARRITQMILDQELHDVASMRTMQTDYMSGIATDFKQHVLPLLQPTTEKGIKALASLLTWDGVMSVGSVDAQMFERYFLALQTLGGEETNATRWDDSMWVFNTFAGRRADPLCQFNDTVSGTAAVGAATVPRCLVFAAEQLDILAKGSKSRGKWGRSCHAARYTHQILGSTPLACMANREVAHGGDKSTINVGSPNIESDETGATQPLTQLHGASYRQIIDWSDVETNSLFVFGPGQSGNLLSKNYDDLVSLWANGEYLPMSTSEHLVDTILLKP